MSVGVGRVCVGDESRILKIFLVVLKDHIENDENVIKKNYSYSPSYAFLRIRDHE